MRTKLLLFWNRINALKSSSTVSQLICTYDNGAGQFSCRPRPRCLSSYKLNLKKTTHSASYSSQILKPKEKFPLLGNIYKQNLLRQYSGLEILRPKTKDDTSMAVDGIIQNMSKTMNTIRMNGTKKNSKILVKNMSSSFAPSENILFRQLLEYKSYTYTYLLADVATNEAILIDPVINTVDRDVRLVFELGLNLLYAVNTHVHADHITGSGSIKKLIPSCKSVIAEVSNARADVKVKEGDIIKFGQFQLEARSTPGHTDGCMSFVWHEKGMVFTGDALLIRGCGRTDFQQGNPGTLYDSVHKKILSLPQHFKVFPGHDYTGQTMSSVGEELRFNPRLTKPKNEFIEVMSKLNLPYPKQIDKALPANMVCGVFDVPENR